MQAGHEEEQEAADVVNNLRSPLRDDKRTLVPLRRGVPRQETADPAGDDGEESRKHPAQHTRCRPLEDRAQRCIDGSSDVLRRQLHPRQEVLDHPGHGEETHERRQQVLVSDPHRHQRTVHQHEPQHTGK